MWKYGIAIPILALVFWLFFNQDVLAPVPEAAVEDGTAATGTPPAVISAATSAPVLPADLEVVKTEHLERDSVAELPDVIATSVPAWSGEESDLSLFRRAQEFSEDFYPDLTLEEAGKIQESRNKDWALTSGAYFYMKEGIGATIRGSLSADDPWRTLYRRENPEDTDEGLHPQNIFRLVLLKQFLDLEQQVYFRVKRDNLSDSQFRNDSNGLLFFNRYRDANNLYYTGIRVDGRVTIKKKQAGKYHTLYYERFLDGDYDRENNPNLLPKDIWLGLKSRVEDMPDGRVKIQVLWDKGRVNDWRLLAEAVDDGKSYGGPALAEPGLAGIRTDFMDVEFADYRIRELE